MSVRDPSDLMKEQSASWPMIDALMGGTEKMREAGKALLPKWPNEDEGSYQTRLQTATLHPVFPRTVLVNAARPFSKPPMIDADGIPPEWLENVDLQGTSLAQFANHLLQLALAYGLAGVLVDYPKAGGVKTQADEKQSGVRPYFVAYKGSDILGWRLAGQRLAQLRLLERVEVDDGEWATKAIEQVRVLTPGAWQVWRKSDDARRDWQLFDDGTTTLDVIPFEFVYGLRHGFGQGKSPLLSMAYQNVEHYQSSSDQQTILHVARVPILFGVGLGNEPITIGASHAVTSSNPDAKLSYTEHTGTAIEAGRQSLLDLEERMRATGAELISQKQAQTTATQVNAEGDASKSTLQQIVEAFEESLEALLSLMGRWVSKQINPEVALFKSYEQMPAGDHQVLASAKSAGVISRQTMFEEMQRRDVLSMDRTWEDEQARMKDEPPPATPPTPPASPAPAPNAKPDDQNQPQQ